MPTELLNESLTNSTVAVDPANLMAARLDDLILGRKLQFPIFDDAGLLLLAEGNVITPEFKRLLKQRDLGSVQVHHEDLQRICLQLHPDEEPLEQGLDSQLAAQLDQVIDSGLLFVQNSGPAMRQQVVFHGRKAYDLDRHNALQQQRHTTSESLGGLMKEAVRGKAVSSTAVTGLAAHCLADMADDTDSVLAVALQATSDPQLSDHCLKMSTLGMAIGIEMGFDADNCRRIGVAGLIHDWGMARIPSEIRSAPRRLSEHEFFAIRKHPIFTAEILERMPGIPSMVPIVVYQVHERPNGRGYPRGRRGDRIHPFARILSVADTYSALIEPRAYRPPLAPYAAMECLLKLAHTRDVDPDAARALLMVLSLFPIGSYVALSDGSVARVLRRNDDRYTQPIVEIVQDADGQRVASGNDAAVLDLSQSEQTIVQALPTPGREEALLSPEILTPTRPHH